MRTAVVILNWNTRNQLERWLPGIYESCRNVEGAELVVADNGSTDGSVEFLNRNYSSIKVLSFEENLGFTGGYNRAFEEISSSNIDLEYFVLLNSDIEVPCGWLEPLLSYMDLHPECAGCGPKLLALDSKDGKYIRTDRFEYAGAAGGYIDRFGYPFCRGRAMKMTECDYGQYDKSVKDVLWVSGACLVTRASLWGRGLDERFFAHMEEIDWCWRKQIEGYSITVIPESRVWHLGGGTLAQDSPFKLKLNFRNNLLLLNNNLPATLGHSKARLTIVLRMILDGCSGVVYLIGGRTDYFKSVIAAHKEYRSLKTTPPRPYKHIKISGICRISIIFHSLIRKDKVFDYIKRYEDSH